VLRQATDAATELDVAGRQTTSAVLDGAPAVRVRWTYTRGGSAPGPAGGALPPEAGTDEVVLRGGRIAAYTRTPDAATLRARAQALGLALAAATPPGAAAPAPGPASGRPGPGPGLWLLAAGIALAGVVLLALGKRPADP
jgi:hypothetical protein